MPRRLGAMDAGRDENARKHQSGREGKVGEGGEGYRNINIKQRRKRAEGQLRQRSLREAEREVER